MVPSKYFVTFAIIWSPIKGLIAAVAAADVDVDVVDRGDLGLELARLRHEDRRKSDLMDPRELGLLFHFLHPGQCWKIF